MTSMTRWIGAALVAALTVPTLAVAKRDFGVYGLGARIGFSIDPDQFVVGGHLDLGDVADRLQFQPIVEFGFGDDLTVVTALADFNYHFREEWEDLTPYIGAGIGPVFVSNDFADDTEVGLTIQGGLKKQLGDGNYSWLGEVRVGILDSPDVKFVAGFALGN